MHYSPSNCFSILLDTPRALTSHDFIVRAIPSFICLVIVVALLSRPFRAIFSLLFSIFNIKSDQFHHFYVQHIVWQPRQVLSMLTITFVLLATPYNAECFTQKFSFACEIYPNEIENTSYENILSLLVAPNSIFSTQKTFEGLYTLWISYLYMHNIYSRLSLIRSPLGPCTRSLAGIARWLQLRK